MSVIKNKFFLKVLLTYCLIIVIGLGAATYLITSSMLNVMIKTEADYEHKIVQQVQLYAEEKFKTLDQIFIQLYVKYYNNPSITELLNPGLNIRVPPTERDYRINDFIRNLCRTNSFITDVLLVDYERKEIYFTSNDLSRDLSLNYNFFQSALLQKIRAGHNAKVLVPNYLPRYINGNRNYPVFSIFLNLFDLNNIQDERKVGAIIINLKPEIFQNAYKDLNNGLKGKILVADSEGVIIFDSGGALAGQKLSAAGKGLFHPSLLKGATDVIINKSVSDSTGLTFLNIVAKNVMLKDINKIRMKMINIIVVCLLAALLVSALTSRLFSKRINRLVEQMRIVENGNLDNELIIHSNDEIGYLERSLNKMCAQLSAYVKTVYVAEIKTKTAELKALQAQINPHFMFNTLESIRAKAILNQDKQTAKMIYILGSMFRWNLRMKEMFVTLSDETDYLLSYLELQKIRFNNKFEVEFAIPELLQTLKVPKFVLQPIVENAIFHGMQNEAGQGRIMITGCHRDGALVIEVTDNGEGMCPEKLEQVNASLHDDSPDDDLYHIGLKNVQQRLTILFGKPYGLTIRSSTGAGTTVTVVMPPTPEKETIVNV